MRKRGKLRPGQVRLLTIILGALALLLVPLSTWLSSVHILYAGLICYILVVLVWFRLNRCPHCRRHLGTHTGLYCPYCKEKL